MSYLSRMLAGNMSVNDERAWYPASLTGVTASREYVTPATALKISTFYACVSLLSDCIAMLPKFVYRRLSDNERERASNHPLFDVVSLSPNAQQTAFEFYNMMTGHALMRGNAYAQIVPGPRGPADQLIPLHPDRVRIENLEGGGYRYKVRQANGIDKPFNDEDILHLRGFLQEIVKGLDLTIHAAESLGLSLASQKYSARFYGNDASPGGLLKVKGKLSDDGQKRLKSSWDEAHSGGNQHRVAVLEDGLEWQAIGIDPRAAQHIEREEFQAEDLCRWMRVPPHMVGLTSKSTSWGSGIEQMSIGFVTYTLMPWIERWEQAISRDLIIAPKVYFVEFVVDGLLRGDALGRYNVYRIGRELGMYSANDLLRLENQNPRTDPDGDTYIRDMGRSISSAQTATPPDDADAGRAHYRELLQETAARIVRKEIAAMQRAVKKAGNDDAWIEAVNAFYGDHADFVSQSLRIAPEAAGRYVGQQAMALIEGGPGVMADWEARRTDDLVSLVLEGQHHE